MATEQAAEQVLILGEAIYNPVDAQGKANFGVGPGDVLKLKYIDKEPPHGFAQFKNQIFVCKVVSFVVDRPKKVNGVMIGDGEIMLRLKWLNGPAVFMARNAKKYPEQNYKLDDFNNQFSISKREPREP